MCRYSRKENTDTHKYCRKCERIKERSEFNKNRSRGDGLCYVCKECKKIEGKKRREDPEYKEAYKIYKRKWYKKNPEKGREYSRRYREANPDKIIAYQNSEKERERNRLKQRKRRQDPAVRLRDNVSRTISRTLKNQGCKKDNRTFKALPYSIQELMAHLEEYFDENMTWENYGSYWHLDHIKPRILFLYTSLSDNQFLECWSLENLRPMEKRANLRKGSLFEGERHKQKPLDRI